MAPGSQPRNVQGQRAWAAFSWQNGQVLPYCSCRRHTRVHCCLLNTTSHEAASPDRTHGSLPRSQSGCSAQLCGELALSRRRPGTGPRQTDCSPLKWSRGLSQHTTQTVQVSPLLSALLDIVHCCHPFKIPSFQLTKTTPDTQSLMCSHKCQEREEQTSALPGRLETEQRCHVD